MPRITIMGALAVAAMLVVGGSICASFSPSAGPSAANPVVADMAPRERDLIQQIEVADCRESVVAGREARLDASDSRQGRSELLQNADLVAQFCGCKFEATSRFLTKREVVTRWLSPDAAAKDRLSVKGEAGLDRAVDDCAEKFGLRTLPATGS
jgi:hypothetical protein